MSFGIKNFKRQKDDSKASAQKQHISTVIMGEDLAAVLKLVQLKQAMGPESLRLITPRFLTKQILIDHYTGQVSTLRDNQKTLEIMAKFPHAKSHRFDQEPQFAKEGQFHKFGSRAKPMEIRQNEDYFMAPRQEIELSSLFSPNDWSELDEILKTYQSVRIVEKIEKQNPTDLANRDEWWLLFKDLGEVTCTELWLSLPARTVLKASSQGQTLPTEAAAWYASIKHQAGIALSFDLKKELHPEPRTLFVPQSMTHEWGHFIVDVQPYSEEKKCYPVNALILMHEDEPTSELMADKIKLLKRVFERVFNDFEKNVTKEHIIVSEDYLEWSSEPQLAEAVLIGVPSLHVIGATAAATLTERFNTRSLLTL